MDHVRLDDADILLGLMGTFREFQENAAFALDTVDNDILAISEALEARIAQAETDVEAAIEEVKHCEEALYSCEESSYVDEDGEIIEPDCSIELQAASEAGQALRDIERYLERCLSMRELLQQEVHSYQSRSRNLKNLVTSDRDAVLSHLTALAWRYDQAAHYALRREMEPEATPLAGHCAWEETIEIVGSPLEQAKLRAALGKFALTSQGESMLVVLCDFGCRIRFMDWEASQETSAKFEKPTNEIHIWRGLQNHSAEAIAAHIAHEAYHAVCYKPNSIDQEYRAYKTQSEVWQSIKGPETDLQNDGVSVLIGRGEEHAKEVIRRMYIKDNLPEF